MKERRREERKRENSKGGRDGEGEEEGKKLNESHSYVFHSPASEFTTCRASEGERCLEARRGVVLLPALIMQESGSVGVAPTLWPQIEPLHSLAKGFFLFFLSKLIPPTHSSGDISTHSLRCRMLCCKRLCGVLKALSEEFLNESMMAFSASLYQIEE